MYVLANVVGGRKFWFLLHSKGGSFGLGIGEHASDLLRTRVIPCIAGKMLADEFAISVSISHVLERLEKLIAFVWRALGLCFSFWLRLRVQVTRGCGKVGGMALRIGARSRKLWSKQRYAQTLGKAIEVVGGAREPGGGHCCALDKPSDEDGGWS